MVSSRRAIASVLLIFSAAISVWAQTKLEKLANASVSGKVLKDGEQVTGVRLVAKYLTGAIHGQIKIEGDEVIASQRLSVWITQLNPNHPDDEFLNGNSAPQVDSRKRFVAEGLAAGTYQVSVAVFDANRQDTQRIFKQQVTVVDNAVSEVTITIKPQ
jgi:beta-xylosidase